MTLLDLENFVIRAFCTLDSTTFQEVDEKAYYSHNNKKELILNMDRLFSKIREKGIGNLSVKESKCKYCYPKGNAYSFHNPVTGEFIIRYVIAYDDLTEDGEHMFRVEECRNKPIPDDFLEN